MNVHVPNSSARPAPHTMENSSGIETNLTSWKRILLLIIAITVHNIPGKLGKKQVTFFKLLPWFVVAVDFMHCKQQVCEIMIHNLWNYMSKV